MLVEVRMDILIPHINNIIEVNLDISQRPPLRNLTKNLNTNHVGGEGVYWWCEAEPVFSLTSNCVGYVPVGVILQY